MALMYFQIHKAYQLILDNYHIRMIKIINALSHIFPYLLNIISYFDWM